MPELAEPLPELPEPLDVPFPLALPDEPFAAPFADDPAVPEPFDEDEPAACGPLWSGRFEPVVPFAFEPFVRAVLALRPSEAPACALPVPFVLSFEPFAPLFDPFEPPAPLLDPLAPLLERLEPLSEPFEPLLDPFAPLLEPFEPSPEPFAPLLEAFPDRPDPPAEPPLDVSPPLEPELPFELL